MEQSGSVTVIVIPKTTVGLIGSWFISRRFFSYIDFVTSNGRICGTGVGPLEKCGRIEEEHNKPQTG
jgi:hypothetical protein